MNYNKIAIYPGTFDPITLGHLDIAKRAATVFGKVVIAVAQNSSKQCYFDYQQRLELVNQAVAGIDNLTVKGFNGLVVDFARANQAQVIIRGLRMISDFEHEFQMALTNRKLSGDIETLFLMPHPNYSFISSQLVKEIAVLGGDLSEFLPPASIEALKEKIKNG
jgi:pantetheine-phosphate adenylyltransferase